MKILQRYIGLTVLSYTLVIMLILAAILCLANLLKISNLLVKGMSPLLILKFMYFIVLSLLDFAIPMALLVGTLLVFGRFASDNEITAMRASGIGLRTITAPIILLGILFMLASLYLNSFVIPDNTYKTRQLRKQAGAQGPEVLLEPGEFIEFPGYAIKIRNREGDYFRNIAIYQYEGGRLANVILAKRAKLETDQARKLCYLYLEDGSLDEYDLENPQISARTVFGTLRYPIDLTATFADAEDTSKRSKDMTSLELLSHRRKLIRAGAEPGDICLLTTELHQRLSFSVACLTFVLIGIPLAITTHRGEKSIGMAISLVVFFVFYLFLLVSKAVDDQPDKFPWMIVWIPNLFYSLLGIFLTVKYTRI